MGDVEVQTATERVGEGRHTAMVHRDWEIWGPCGGYVAAIALRAAGAESGLVRPASFFCHYLSVAEFAPVDLVVTPLRTGRTVLAQRVEMTQQGRPVLDAMVWSVGDVAGLEHEDVSPPDVPGPDDADSGGARQQPNGFAFWDNFDQRLVNTSETPEAWPPTEALPPTWRMWVRCRPTATFADPWVERRAFADRARRGELAPGRAAAQVSRPAVHRAESRSVRVVPVSRQRLGVDAARCAFARRGSRPPLVDRPRVVRGAQAHRQRRRTGGVPAHLTGVEEAAPARGAAYSAV